MSLDHLAAQVSVFRGTRATIVEEQLPLGAMLERIRDGTYKPWIDALQGYRRGFGEEAYKTEKIKIRAFTPCCALITRDKDVDWPQKLISTTGIVHYDIDHVDAPEEVKAQLASDNRVVFAFVSPSGEGVKVGVAASGITDRDTYDAVWKALLADLQRTYATWTFKTDTHVKFLHALCFVSHDPLMYVNTEAVPFLMPASIPKAPRKLRAVPQPGTGESDEARAIEALRYIPSDDREIWLAVGMALHSTGEAWARSAWDDWSQSSEKYDPRTQESSWAHFIVDGGRTIATMFDLAKKYGYRPPRRARVQASTPRAVPLMGQAAPTSVPPEGTGAPEEAAAGTPVPTAPSTRANITLNTEMTRIVDEGQAALMALPNAPVIYQRARELTVIARGVPPPKWLHRPHDMPVMMTASPAHLHELATQAAHWWQWDGRMDDWKEVLPPRWLIPTLQGRTTWPFPLLEGIVASPTIRPDGTLLTDPGYDKDTGLYLDTNGTTFPAIASKPTIDDARTAIGHLQEAVQDFPFAEAWHFSATLAAMLSLVCRFAVLGNVPLFAIRANTPGSGKSLLADVISIIGTGRPAPRWPEAKDDEEERKRLMTVALAGYPCLHIDNVVGPLGSPALDLALTSPTYSDRLLGSNESREVPLAMVWLASGNNMQMQGDMARRVVPIDLDAKMEKPEERTGFTHDPLLAWVIKHRPRLTVAALTVARAFFVAGCPKQELTRFGAFEPWSNLVREALVWAGEDDPCEGRKNITAESNPEYEQLAALLDAWAECYPKHDTHTLAAVWSDIQIGAVPSPTPPNKWNALQDALGAWDRRYDGQSLDTRRVGDAFRKFQGRMIGTRRLINTGKDRTGKTEWRIETF